MAAPAKRPLKILNVEGHAPIRSARSRALRRAGAQVREAATAADALRSIAAQPPDAAIIPVTLEDASGFDICRRIKSNPATSAIHIVHTTKRYSDEESRQASLIGAHAYIEEPADWTVLVEQIRGLVDRSERAGAEVSRLRGELARDVGALEATLQRSQVILDVPPAGLLGVQAETGVQANVLVVDDEALVRDVTRSILQRRGYSVLTADGGAAALEILDTRADEIGLVMLDWWMPVMDGRTTLTALQRLKPDLPVIVISGQNYDELVHAVCHSPNVRFLAKPYTVDQVLQAVRAAAPSLKAKARTKR